MRHQSRLAEYLDSDTNGVQDRQASRRVRRKLVGQAWNDKSVQQHRHAEQSTAQSIGGIRTTQFAEPTIQ